MRGRHAVLQQNPVFAEADPAALGRLVDASRAAHYPPGAVILSDGEQADRVFALDAGRVRVYHLAPTGEEVVVKLFGAPAIFGEAEALGGYHYLENVAALEACDLLVIPVGAFVTFLQEDRHAAYRMLVDVATRLAIASYNEKSLAFHPSTVRLANYLIDYAQWTNPSDTKQWHIALTQDQMAAAIGVTRRSVAKDIADWKREGILQRRGGHYVVHDLEALSRYGDADRLALSYSIRTTAAR